MDTFFICALPRSRTAWLANLLTQGNMFCFHEALLGCSNFVGLERKFIGTGRSIVGNSDCGNALFVDGLLDTFPDAKLIVIENDIRQSIKSMQAAGIPGAYREALEPIQTALDKIKERYAPLMLDVRRLTLEACTMLWEYCGSSQLFDVQRWRMLEDINMEVFPDRLVQKVLTNRKSIDSLWSLCDTAEV